MDVRGLNESLIAARQHAMCQPPFSNLINVRLGRVIIAEIKHKTVDQQHLVRIAQVVFVCIPRQQKLRKTGGAVRSLRAGGTTGQETVRRARFAHGAALSTVGAATLKCSPTHLIGLKMRSASLLNVIPNMPVVPRGFKMRHGIP